MMLKNLFFLLTVTLLLSFCTTRHPQNTLELREAIQEELGKAEGRFAVAFKYLDKPEEEILINAHEVFHAASTMKTPMLLEVYKQAEEGKFNLDDSLLVSNGFKSIVDSSLYALNPEDDSFHELYSQIGKKVSIRDLTYHMII